LARCPDIITKPQRFTCTGDRARIRSVLFGPAGHEEMNPQFEGVLTEAPPVIYLRSRN
jgi:hypothetical protein